MTIVEHILSAGGPVARALGDGYEPRGEQVAMALAVERAMADRSHLLVEAGTGVGKSFAYLVPAIVRAMRGETVVVATNTIALQEQLVERDIPLLHSTIRDPKSSGDEAIAEWTGVLRPVLVKGRNNYVSVRRLALASARQDRLFPYEDQRRSLHAVEDWAYDTTDGTRSTLPVLERPEVWDHAMSDADNCMGRKCEQYAKCFYQAARRRMEGANLLVCNHAVYFSDLALRAGGTGFLPKYQHVVLDEAHQVEEVASEHLGMSLSEGRVIFLLRTLFDPKRRKGYLESARLAVGDAEATERAINLTLRAGAAATEFFEAWHVLIESGRLGSGRVRRAGLVENGLTPALRELALRLQAMKDLVKEEQDRFELNSYAKRAADLATAAEAFVEQKLESQVYWAEVAEGSRRYGRARVKLACAPVEVGPVLKELLFTNEHSVTLTSATLATGGPAGRAHGGDDRSDPAFAHVMGRLGCDGASTLLLGSPFEYARQVELHIDRTMVSPGKGIRHQASGIRGSDAENGFEAALTERILEHVRATDGGAFVLFTSFSTLYAAADRLSRPLADLGMTVLVQNRDGPRTELLRRFREEERSVLFGAASFWQGVDVPGRALRNVIITRLPFEPPDRPLAEARAELITLRGGDPFREDSLPRAVIRFKQGFGRLVRSRSDRGRVVVLDPRIVTVGYGRAFLRALPAGVRVVEERAETQPDETRTIRTH